MMHPFSLKTLLCIALLVCVSGVHGIAKENLPTKTIPIYKGQKSISFKQVLHGYDFIDYTFEAKAGQEVDITLTSNHLSNYFNLLYDKDPNALFIGSTLGNHYKAVLPNHGVYTIRVYLMRNAARRGEKAAYTLDFHLSETLAPQVIDPEKGPRYYDASGTIPCKYRNQESQCHFRVLRDLKNHFAQVWIEKMASDAHPFRVLIFDKTHFKQEDGTTLRGERRDDNWVIFIDNEESYVIPDALIHGG